MDQLPRLFAHFFGFTIAMMALNSVDFNRFLRKNKVWQAQLLYLVLAMVLGYGVAQFLIALTIQFR